MILRREDKSNRRCQSRISLRKWRSSSIVPSSPNLIRLLAIISSSFKVIILKGIHPMEASMIETCNGLNKETLRLKAKDAKKRKIN
jgi:hypothetical protein